MMPLYYLDKYSIYRKIFGSFILPNMRYIVNKKEITQGSVPCVKRDVEGGAPKNYKYETISSL